MSIINDKPAEEWIEKTHPKNGLFRADWTEDGHGISLEDTGFGIRYEWYYKDGKRVNGISRGWWPNGNLKQEFTFKNGKRDGLGTGWYKNGQKRLVRFYKDGKET
tara:strand:- start:20 stop:334 length:315 start_codon:yes stop_codon:yes gene_type:complete